jgi:hypothetical protein
MTFMRKAVRPVGHDRADVAAADDAERLVEQLHPHEAVLFPLAGLGGGIGGRDLARQRHHQRHRVLGRGDGVAERRVHHDDAAGRGRRQVDIVDADAGPADDLEPAGPLDDLGRDLAERAHGEAVIAGDRLGQRRLVGAELGPVVGLDAAVGEDFHRRRRQLVGDQDAG